MRKQRTSMRKQRTSRRKQGLPRRKSNLLHNQRVFLARATPLMFPYLCQHPAYSQKIHTGMPHQSAPL
ncbi:rCG48440, isoform CRA_b [Rattus norvegicus]|uniref:RCG48440, isoform CRA_b n=1 Tax=Rattus norvegicus TaxID=10116 RepID=A6HZD8_RAT|nr:rCG48440, isoform CRA_b [Rattus norvegicus]